MSRDLSHVWAAVTTQPWLIEPRKGRVLASVVARRVIGDRLSAEEIDATIGEARAEREAKILAADTVNSSGRGIYVIPVHGTLVHRGSAMNSSGITATEAMAQRFRAAEQDSTVGTIVLDIDSPGGEAAGTMELAAQIAASSKPVVAHANSMAASAAYWIASAADEVVVTPSGEVGSIGVLIVHTDDTAALEAKGVTRTVISAGPHKAEMWGPLTDEARAHLEQQAQAMYGRFVSAVASYRGVSAATVRSDFGGGRMLLADDAKRAGMVDRVESFDATLARLLSGGRVRRRQRAEMRPEDEAELIGLEVACSVPSRR